MYFLLGMKVALGAAAALTGAGALLYMLWRPRRCPKDAPKQDQGSHRGEQSSKSHPPGSQKSSDTGDPTAGSSKECGGDISVVTTTTTTTTTATTTEHSIQKNPNESVHTDKELECVIETKLVKADEPSDTGTSENDTEATECDDDTSACEEGCEVKMKTGTEVHSVPCNKASGIGGVAASEVCNLSQASVGQQVQEVSEVVCEVSVSSEKCQALPASESSVFSTEKTLEGEINCLGNCEVISNPHIIESEQNVITSADKDTSRGDGEACGDAIAGSETLQGTESLSNEAGQTEDKSIPSESLSELKTAVETDESVQVEEVSQEEHCHTVVQPKNPSGSMVSEGSSELHPVLECRNKQEENTHLRELEEEQEMVDKGRKGNDDDDDDEKEGRELLGQCEKEEKPASIVTAEHISETTTIQEESASLSCRSSVENQKHQDEEQKELKATEEVRKVRIEQNTEDDLLCHSSLELEDLEAASTHTTLIPVKEVCPDPDSSQEVKEGGNALADPPLVEGETAPLMPGEGVVNKCSLTKEEPVMNVPKEENQMSSTGRFEEPITKSAEPGDLSSSPSTEIQEGHVSEGLISDEQKEGSAIICQVEEQHTSISHIDQQSSVRKEETAEELPVPVEEKIRSEYCETVESGSLSAAYTRSRTCSEVDKSCSKDLVENVEREDKVSEASEEPITTTTEKIQEDVNQSQSTPPSKEVEGVVENESKPLTVSTKHEDTLDDETPVANSEHQLEKENCRVEEQQQHQKLESAGDGEQGNEKDMEEEKPVANSSQEEVERRDLEKTTTVTSIDVDMKEVEVRGEEPKEKQEIPKPKVTESSEVVDEWSKEDRATSQKPPEKVSGRRRAEKDATKKQVMGTKQEKGPEKVALEKQVPGKSGKPELKTEGKKKTSGKKQRKGEQHKAEKPVEVKPSAGGVIDGMGSGKVISEEKIEVSSKHEETEKKKEKEEKNFKARKVEDVKRRKEEEKVKQVTKGKEKVKQVAKEEKKVKQVMKEEEKVKQLTKEKVKVKQLTKEVKMKQLMKEEEKVKQVTKDEKKVKQVTKEEHKVKQVTEEEEKVKQLTQEEKVKQLTKEEEKVKQVTEDEEKVKQVTKEEEKVKQVTKEEKVKQVTEEEEKVKQLMKEEEKVKQLMEEEEKVKQVTKEEEKVKQLMKEEEKVKQVMKEEEKVKQVMAGEQEEEKKVEDRGEEKVITSQEKDEDVVIEGEDDEVNGKREEQQQQRTRGDSASADLELDLGSELESQNYDASSLQSVDSGQGSSEIEPETLFVPSTYPAPTHDQYIFYDFEIPQSLVGRLIGRRGAFVNKIKATTDATVVVHPHRNRGLKLCSVEGTRQQVAAALKMIREQFPESRYSDVTLEQVSGNGPANLDPTPALDTQTMQVCEAFRSSSSQQMELTAGVVVEVRVSAVVSAGELWVQQPLHPSFSALHRLHTCMNLNYQDGSTTPPLPSPVQERTVCVCRVGEQWMRCQVLCEEEGGGVLVVLLDRGGTINLPATALRQIRYDYMTLPFQATQCFLQGIQPSDDGEAWSDEATEAMRELVGDTILFAAVVSYTPDCVPLISLYRRVHDQFVHLNERLVALGHAQWLSQQSS